MSRVRVGFGCSGRCAPACAVALGLRIGSSLAFWPREGGRDELFGVFGGSCSFSRSVAFSARSVAFSARNTAFSLSSSCTRAVSPSTCRVSVSTRPSNCAISAPFRARDSEGNLDDRLTLLLTHTGRSDASASNPIESIRRTRQAVQPAKPPREQLHREQAREAAALNS